MHECGTQIQECVLILVIKVGISYEMHLSLSWW